MDTEIQFSAPALRDSRGGLASGSSTSVPAMPPADLAKQRPTFLLEITKIGESEAEIRWNVKNFSRLEDEEVESEPFILGGIKWRIIMFPRGNYKKEKKKALYFALYLGIDDFEQLDRRVDVKLTLSVLNQKFSNKCSGESQHVFSPGDEDSDWGFTQFMKLGELQNTSKGWVVDDSICVEADIKILNLDGGASEQKVWTKLMPVEELLVDMKKLRMGGLFPDFVFLAEKKRIPAHKAIVHARCAELGKLIEDKPEVEIRNIRAGVMEMILDYIYFDSIDFDADRILEVSLKAQEFKLFRLACICENLLVQHLSVDNVLVLLMSAEEQHLQGVKEVCLAYIRDHYVEVVTKSGLLQLISKKHSQLMVEIAQAPTLTPPEDSESRPKPPQVSPSTISTDLGMMLQCQVFTDITFIVDNETIKAHKCIISNRCEFFARMFQGGMLEHSSQQITLDLSPAAFKLVLKYLYTNTVSLSVSSLDDVFNLLDLSERFLLKRLKSVCESILKRVLDIDNVVEILKYCGIYDLPDLKQTCLQMISKYRVILCTKEHLSALEHGILVDLAVLLSKPDSQPMPS